MSPRWLSLFLTAALLANARAEAPAGEKLEFELNGARCAAIVPPVATRKNMVLIYCHGYRPEKAPLDPELFPLKRSYADLLAEGWTIASTSYRRSGLIVADAAKDVMALREELAKRFGEPRRVVLHGESMGGAVATWLCETEPLKISGALAVGAALNASLSLEEGGKKIQLTGRSLVPLLFLNNRTETAAPAAYVEKASGLGASRVRPFALSVNRDGHVNVNQREVGQALALLNQWLNTDNHPAVPPDLTLPPHPRPSAMKKAATGGEAALTFINPQYGNVTFDFQTSDLAQLGLTPGSTFKLTRGAKSFAVKLGTTYRDVAKGEWVAFFDGEDRLLVAINGGNAADALGIKLGETATVSTGK